MGQHPMPTSKLSAVKTRSSRRGGAGEQAPPVRNRHEVVPALETDNGIEHGPGTSTRLSDIVPTSEGVANPNGEPTEEAEMGSKRLKWSHEMNKYLYRTYLIITKMETVTTPYSQDLYQRMVEKFPELRRKTIQNILDQRRQLFTKNRIPQNEIRQIRSEVEEFIGIRRTDPTYVTPEARKEPANVDVIEQRIQDALDENLSLYHGTDPTLRPKLQRLKINKDTRRVFTQVNNAIRDRTNSCLSIEELQTIVYASAATVLQLHEQKSQHEPNENPKPTTMPKWERRLKTKIDILRKHLGKLIQGKRGAIKKNKTNKEIEIIISKYRDKENTKIEELIDLLKQKLSVYSNRLRRYKESQLRRRQNKLFNNNQRGFYRSLEHENKLQQSAKDIPNADDTKAFWENIWQQPATHTSKNTWVQNERKIYEKVNMMTPIHITRADLTKALQKTLNWRAPGIDSVHNFWYKKLTSTHDKLAELFNEAIYDPNKIPPFMTQGITYLLPKTETPGPDPSKYRPITCLPTIYKILTSIITEKISHHLEANHIISEEQKGCKKNSRGCKEQLIIDSVVTGEAKKQKKYLYTAYIDYRKAFDSVPHSWLKEVLEIYKINPIVVSMLTKVMNSWKTTLMISKPSAPASKIGCIHIKKGIFQGDSLSALWFCMAINPLSNLLNKGNIGYDIGNTNHNISHLFYMDDLKIYAATKANVQTLLKRTEVFSHDIRMEFGLDKCCINLMARGVHRETERYRLQHNAGEDHIMQMQANDTYKYLGFEQNRGIKIKETKQRLLEEVERRTKLILRTKLSARSMVTAINTYALSMLTYSFGVIEWTRTDLDNVNRATRVMFTKYRAHHPKSSIERFHLPRKKGGRGVLDMKNLHYDQIEALREYFHRKEETSPLHKATVKTDKGITPLNLQNREYSPKEHVVSDADKMEKWRAKELHGRYIYSLSQSHIDTKASCQWLCSGNIFAETEGFMIAMQDQVVATLNHRKHIIKDNTQSSMCRVCSKQNETVEHILSGCSPLAPNEYTNRHNNVAKIIHQHLCRRYKINSNEVPYYKYEPDPVISTDQTTIYWNRTVLTDRTIRHNRPDITVKEIESKITYLIDIAIPAPANIEAKHNDKVQKYLPLAQEIKEIWQQERVTIVPIILGVTAEIPTRLHESIELLGLPPKIYESLQKTVVLDSCRIMRKVLSNTIGNNGQVVTPSEVDRE